MNALVVIALAPVVAALWVRLGARNQRVDIVQKYTFALAMAAVGHLLMYLAARHAAPETPAPVYIPIVALSLLAVGELVAWTATYGMVSRAAPAGFASVTLGLGGYLSGFTGSLVDAVGFAATFGAVAVCMGGACLAALLLRAPLSRLAARAGVAL
jgi:POT family proton-dependent oligopeptide transporter